MALTLKHPTMSGSHTQTTTATSSSTAGPSGPRRMIPPPTKSVEPEEEDLEEDEEEILRRVQEKVRKVKEWKAAIAVKKRAEEEAAQRAEEAVRKKKESEARELEERRQRLAGAATARSRRGSSPRESSVSPQRPVGEIKKGKGEAKAQPVGGDPDNGGERAPCKRCRSKKIPCQMQADNRQLREGQLKANNYNCHFNWKLDWLMMDAARRRNSPPEMPEPGPSRLPKKRRWVVDSGEEEEDRRVGEEEDGEVDEEVEEEEGEEPAPKKAQLEKGKERAE
ncbi:MAG: hypothetical protein NXY57DRAFT_968710 [Lentinula lateritia]|nr:MAG: hypothetical protein NXY57DRAFT_968710 [Lentinula lateritia]